MLREDRLTRPKPIRRFAAPFGSRRFACAFLDAVLAMLSVWRGALKMLRFIRSGRKQSDNAREIGVSTIIIGTWVIVFATLGLGTVAIWSRGYSTTAANQSSFAMTFGSDLLVAAAAGAVGALLGFVFGIPRTLDPASRAAVAAAASQAGPTASSQAALAANTNLERISDWLTTLLIGATLVQSGKVIEWIGRLGDTYGGANGGPTNASVVPLIVVYFFALAFLGVYLITRLYLTYALQQTLALLTGTASLAPVVQARTMPQGSVGTAYPPTLIQASGGTSPLRWSISPNLPTGLTLDPASGSISGTPTAKATRTKYTIVCTDGATPPASGSADLELEVM